MKKVDWTETVAIVRICRNLLITSSLVFGSFSQAQSLNRETTTDIIQRLEAVRSSLPQDEQTNIELRLADLYSERARLSDIEAGNPSCVKCADGKADRQKAIAFYENVLPKVQDEQAQTILLQLGHVYTLNGQAQKAEQLYLKIVRNPKKYHDSMVSHSYLGLADLAFNGKKYGKAKDLLQRALEADSKMSNWATIQRKISWCHFNLGQLNKAQQKAVEVLTYGKKSYQAQLPPAPLYVDMARDFATFLAHGNPSKVDVQDLVRLSPPGEEEALLIYLGDETIRLGKMQAALHIWTQVAKQSKDPNQGIRAHVQLANVHFNLDQKAGVMAELQKIRALWQATPCTDDEICAESQAALKGLLLNWHKKERKAPSHNLTQAFIIYSQIFPSDLDRVLLAASLAQQTGENRTAFKLFRSGAEQCRIQIESAKKNQDQKLLTKLAKQHEESLLAAIEVAEKSQDFSLREIAYNDYVTHLASGEKIALIGYQIAHLAYERKDYSKAAELFHSIATDAQFSDKDLRLKAAHLSIDSLALLKKDPEIEAHSLQYAGLFPQARREFLNHHRVSVEKQTQTTLREKNVDREKLTAQLAVLATTSLANTSKEEQIAHWRLVIESAKRLQDLNAIRLGAHKILSIKKINENDRVFALACLAWVEELQLNFRAAYLATKQITGKRDYQKQLKLATLAELAGLPSQGHYLEFIAITPSRQDANVVRAKLVLRDRHPARRFTEYLSDFKRTPVLAGDLALDVYAKTGDRDFAQLILGDRALRTTWGARMIDRDLTLIKFEQMAQQIRSTSLRSRSLSTITSDLQKRITLLSTLEQDLKQAIRKRDWTLQVVYSDLISKEKRRLSNELISLRAPRGLNQREASLLTQQLQLQAQPLLRAAQNLEAQLAALWSSTHYLNSLASPSTSSHGLRVSLYKREVRNLLAAAPAQHEPRLTAILNTSPASASRQELQRARQNLANAPFSSELLENLVQVAGKRRDETLVQYLLARKEELGKGVHQ